MHKVRGRAPVWPDATVRARESSGTKSTAHSDMRQVSRLRLVPVLAPQEGVEPPAKGLGNLCSIL